MTKTVRIVVHNKESSIAPIRGLFLLTLLGGAIAFFGGLNHLTLLILIGTAPIVASLLYCLHLPLRDHISPTGSFTYLCIAGIASASVGFIFDFVALIILWFLTSSLGASNEFSYQRPHHWYIPAIYLCNLLIAFYTLAWLTFCFTPQKSIIVPGF